MNVLLKDLKKIEKERTFLLWIFCIGWFLLFLSVAIEEYGSAILSAVLIIIINNRFNMWSSIYREEYIKKKEALKNKHRVKIVKCIKKGEII